MKMIWALLPILISIQAFGSQLIIRVGEEPPVTLTHDNIITQFEPSSFATSLPWYPDIKEFTGFKVSELLNQLEIDDAFSVSFIALNDYAASSQIADINKYEPIIAYQVDGKKMRVREKGPYWLLFNLDKYPETNNAVFHSQMVWQIDEIMIHRRQDVDENEL
ncbi:hypothetical protein VIOR3934_19910 [Vibrio orientalis CIP 102891 = ATCC 33934]|uniref:Oxidoreductase molybdopterin-binding domain-containing protein n=1 Tax=Vibrio orientalis CIP 102891 = ATCC 33934 TaxID=675816 RepID=C9QFY4_VIBOR|nr:hypothetical protein [Vibrio orientalis]EEX94329.1 hypothetical protein VIA_001487 [Vibrio orientalis CIP 102891 = ATCC 33934]EGU54127.1 hypothetical protein VIOR3934_19910 [Vibrio orientalis CIP 102891 = ATCC 33934]